MAASCPSRTWSTSMPSATGERESYLWAWFALLLALATPLAGEVKGQEAMSRNAAEYLMNEEPKETCGGPFRPLIPSGIF
jgi:hypothetical protein